MPLLADSSSGNFLVTPSLGVMIWTLIAFLIALFLAIVGVASTHFQIEYVTAHAFWFVVAAYVVLALGTLIDGL